MTSKKHTMHRFVAVAAVLLAFCLVFMMPVGATERPADLPTATVKELADGEGPTEFGLTFARNFTADYVTPEQLSTYGQWYADFILTTNKEMTVGTDGETSGYLAGNYGSFGWLKVPDKTGLGSLDNVEIPANTAMPVMASALGMQKYSYIYESVQTFLCGMYLNSGFLENNPDIVITLELRMINPNDVPEDLDMNVIMEKSFVIGDSYEFALEWTLTCKDEDGSSLFYKDDGFNPTTYTVLTPTFTLVEPVKEGYVFAGWKDADGQLHETVSIEKGTYGDKTYTATWKKLHTVTINANGGAGTMTAEPVIDGESFILPDCTFTAPEGEVFKAWDIDGTEYDAGSSYTVTKDIEVIALWRDIYVEPSFDDAIREIQEEDGKITIIFSENQENIVPPGDENSVVIIYDENSGASMYLTCSEVTTESENDGDVSVKSVVVEEVNINYRNNAQTGENADISEIEYLLDIALKTPNTPLPKIDASFDEEKATQISNKYTNHKPLAMLTAQTNVDEINSNLIDDDEKDKIRLFFIIPKEELDAVIGTGTLVGYHIYGNNIDKIDAVVNPEIYVPNEESGDKYYVVTLVGSHFSTYALGIAPASEGEDFGNEDNSDSVSSSSATDTGSGNYQYYPRSVPTDGIISFGTSKVITGMELPVGSDGTVTLNIKPDFAMPENGYYTFEIDAPGYNTDAKINGELSFQISVADLEAAGYTAEDIVLFHGTAAEDGTITWEALPTNLVKNENGVAYYKAAINSCSPFYIGFVKDGSIVNTEVVDPVTPPTDTPVTPNEPEVLPPVDEPETPESPAPILGVLVGLVAVVALRRK